MIHGFFFRFFKVTHSKWLSAVLSKMAYCVFFCKYLLERLFTKPRIVIGNPDAALETISQVHPDPNGKPLIVNSQLDEKLDLSIIVPVYNYVDLIEGNIQSILNQNTQFTYQLILVDDGSTDGAQDILRRYEDHPKVKVIFQKNQGIAGARNTGINHAAGKYIMFIDCDDTVENDLVETLMTRAYQDDCDVVMCAHNLVKERNGVVYSVIPNLYPEYNLMGYAENARILNYAGLPWCKVYKRELWERVRFLPGYWFEDTIIHSLLFTQCKRFAYEPKICYQYRWYEKNFSHIQGSKVNPKCIDAYWMLIPILQKHRELGLPRDERYETMLIKHLSAYYYNKISGLDDKVVDALFILACDLLKQFGADTSGKLPYMLRVTKKAMEQGDMNLWKLAIKYQK